jgi:hypothetical protein
MPTIFLLSRGLSRFAKVQHGRRVGRQLDTLLTAERLQQHLDPAGACWVRRRFSLGFGRSHIVRPASPRPIDRMARVQRPPIEANIGAETARLDEPLRTIVAVLAQALKRAEPKLVNVAVMWLDVIADCRRLDDAALQAEVAERMREQLLPPDPCPARGAIPGVPLRGSAADSHGSNHPSVERRAD